MNIYKLTLGALVALALTACGNNPEAEATETDDHAHQEHMNHDHSSGMPVNPEDVWVAEGAKVFFKNLKDGDTITSPVLIQFGAEGMAVVPAGQIVRGTGHHHIIIDAGVVKPGEVVPADENNIHYGGGQTEAEINLSPGAHTLTLQFANGIHQSYGEQMSATINVFVK